MVGVGYDADQLLDWSLEKIRHFYLVSQKRAAREKHLTDLSRTRAVHVGAASLVDNHGRSFYKGKERELIEAINGVREDNPEANRAALAKRLTKIGVTQKYAPRRQNTVGPGSS